MSTAISFLHIGHIFYIIVNKVNKKIENIILIIALIVSAFALLFTFLYPDAFPLYSLAMANIKSFLFFYIVSISNSAWIFIVSKRYFSSRVGIISYFGKNSVIFLAFHMDISIEIGWLFVALMNISVPLFWASVIAIFIELIVLVVSALFINKYMSFIVKFPFQKKFL